MRYFNDFIYVQTKTFQRMVKSLKYLPIIVIGLVACQLILNIAKNILFTIGIGSYVGSIGIYILEIFLLSFIFSVLRMAVVRNTNYKGFIREEKSQYVIKIIQLGFILYIVDLALGMLRIEYVELITHIIILIVLNPLPETIYLENYDGFGSIQYTIDFLSKNIFSWGIPNILIVLLFLLMNFSYWIPFSMEMDRTIQSALSVFIYLTVYGIMMIYRGNLFYILSGSNIRKREFQEKF